MHISKTFIRKTLKWILITVSAFCILGIAGFFSFRNVIFKKAIEKAQAIVANRTNMKLDIKSASFSGLSAVQLQGISLVPDGRDTLLKVDSLSISIKLFPLLAGRIRFEELNIANSQLYLRKDSLQTNFRNLIKKTDKETEKKDTSADKSETVFNYIKTLLRYLPDNVKVRNASLKIKYNDSTRFISINRLDWTDKKFIAVISPEKQYSQAEWMAEGYFDKYDIKGEVTLAAMDGNPVNFYFTEFITAGLLFNKINLKLNSLDYNNHRLYFNGAGNVDGLKMYHTKLSADTVVFDSAAADLHVQLTRNFIEIDSATVFKVNAITMGTFARYPIGHDKQYALKITIPQMETQDFFSSLPAGMFSTFEGIKVKGRLAYNLNFEMDGAQPDSLIFTSELKKENFAIIKYGAENFAKINGPFMHTVYENGAPMRSFVVGPDNPNYTPFDQISPYFINSVLINEDPSFFYHRGFITESFRESIAENYKAGRFVRGGSTISMQLVKNVFLERKKTVARKAEEALIVWLIENNGICPKQRMFEVYANIIEFGPGVYGIGEGTRFYFAKSPAQLTLQEGIYLSNIIPRPKGFKYGFEKDGSLKPWMLDKARVVVNRMVTREMMPAADTVNINLQVQLKGPAKNYITPADTLMIAPADTTDDFDF